MFRTPNSTTVLWVAITVMFLVFQSALVLATQPEGSLRLALVAALLGLGAATSRLALTYDPNLTQANRAADLVICMLAALALGPAAGPIVVLVASVAVSRLSPQPWSHALVDGLRLALACLGSATIFVWITGSIPPITSWPTDWLVVPGFVGAVVAFYALSTVISVLARRTAESWSVNAPRMLGVGDALGILIVVILLPIANSNHIVAPLIVAIPLVSLLLSHQALVQAQREARATMEGLADALERRDPYTHAHSLRVAQYATLLLDHLPNVRPVERSATIVAARVHDVGKVATRDEALRKPGRLNADEWEEIQLHSSIGAAIVERLPRYRETADIVRHHHERWDGTGYPDGLAGTAIPLGSRIIAVADTFDAMTSDRAYRRALSANEALAELRAKAGSQFDPDVVSAFEQAQPVILATNSSFTTQEPLDADDLLSGVAD